MNVHDDGPDETQNDGRLPIHDVRDIDVDQFDLQDTDVDKITDVDISTQQGAKCNAFLHSCVKCMMLAGGAKKNETVLQSSTE